MTNSRKPGPSGASETAPQDRPWIVLESLQEIEAWIERLNHELQQLGEAAPDRGQGVCLTLAQGGEIAIHTNADGDILLDVDSAAEWVAPLIVAATGAQAPRGTVWLVPGDRLIQLMMGLNSLIASERLILRHAFRSRKF